MTRDEAQAHALQKWLDNKGIGCIIAPTGLGKTRIATNMIGKMLSRYPTLRFIVVVPTTTLKEQWESILDKLGYGFNVQVLVINTAIKQHYECNILVIDECHRLGSDAFQKVFDTIHYRFIMCLTATLERLDGHETIIKDHCPVIERITLTEALMNGWISPYKEYKVLLHIKDIDEYKKFNKLFIKYFEYFNFDFPLAMNCLGRNGFRFRSQLANTLVRERDPSKRKKLISLKIKEITLNAMGFMRTVQARKNFINNHPKKIEIARKIIEARPNCKIITFSNSIGMARKIGIGNIYSGKDSKKQGKAIMDEFLECKQGVLNTMQKVNEGLDCPGLSVAIMLGNDSSKIKRTQRIGRVCRLEEGKQAEIFILVIDDTVETKWVEKSQASENVITIDEKGLDYVLRGQEPPVYKKPVKKIQFRF